MKRIAAFAFLVLTACGGGDGPPLPGPVPTPRPGALVLSAVWGNPLGVALVCGGPGLSSPFGCTLPAGTLWGVVPAPGNGGMGCVDPEPNVCFQPDNGRLGYHAAEGMALISASTVPRDKVISVEAVVTLNSMDCGAVAYVGPVIYDGEGAADDPTGNYRSLYLSCPADNGPVRLWLYGPTKAGVLSPWAFPMGSTHALRIDFVPGASFTYYLDGNVVFVETPGSYSQDPFTFTQDPHPSLWFGSTNGAIGRFDTYSGP